MMDGFKSKKKSKSARTRLYWALEELRDKITREGGQVVEFSPRPTLWYEVAAEAYRELNTPVSLSAAILLREDPLQLASLKVDPHQYNDVESFERDRAAVELLRKFQGLPGTTADSRRENALEKAREAEAACLKTNERVLDWQYGAGYPAGLSTVIHRARLKIAHVLGEYDLDRHLRACRWGPGADADNLRPYVSSYHKFSKNLSGTSGTAGYLAALLGSNRLWSTWLSGHEEVGCFTPLFRRLMGNRYTTVPKQALNDRSICIEPGVNIYLQLGLGSVIRRLLKRVGINLNSQEWNQWLAWFASKDGFWATIDLSSASDTIARRLIQLLLLPEQHPDPEIERKFSHLRVWYRVLDDLRSKFTNYGDKKTPRWELNHKWSSMGNGYTFELETLVFWALSSAAAEQEGGKCAAVYGDDIIVEKHSYARVTEVLELCGFTVNTRKSYNSSYFRESCGMDAFDGKILSTYRLESLDNISDTYALHNGLRRLGLTRAAAVVLRAIPKALRLYGPLEAGDSVLHNADHSLWEYRLHAREDQYFFWGISLKTLRFVPLETRNESYEPAILHSLASSVPSGDHPLCGDYRWGSEGVATLPDGVWTVGRTLLGRESLERAQFLTAA